MFARSFLEKKTSDVKLQIHTKADGRQVTIPAHKMVLWEASKILEAEMQRRNSKEETPTVLELDGDMNDAMLFVRFLYTRKLDHLTLDVYSSLLRAAHKYQVKDLLLLCHKRIADDVTPLNVCKILVSLDALPNLLIHCRKLILDYAFLIFWKNLHLVLDKEEMLILLKSDKLNVWNENQVLCAVWEWGRVHCALKNESLDTIESVIADFLPLIRSPLLQYISPDDPLYKLWQDYVTTLRTKKGKRQKTSFEARNADEVRKAVRFAHVASFPKKAKVLRKSKMEEGRLKLLGFSANCDMLLSGFSVQMTVCQKIESDNEFTVRVLLNNAQVPCLCPSEAVLIDQYTTPKSFETQSSKSLTSNQTQNEEIAEYFYVYDILIEFNTPILLLQSTKISPKKYRLCLVNDLFSKPDVTFTKYIFFNEHLDLDENLELHLKDRHTCITNFYYFL